MSDDLYLPPRIEAFLFDLGGVIIELDWNRVFQQWAKHSPLSVQEIGNRFEMDDAYEQHERGQLSAAQYFAHVRAIVNFKGTDEAFVQGWNAVFVNEVNDVVNILPRLKSKLPVYLLTNSNPTHEIFWRTTFPEAINLFTGVFVSSTLGHRKPDRSAFDAVAEKTGIVLTSMLFFDDTIQNVEGARAAGLQAVHVKAPSDVSRAFAQKSGIM